MGFRRRIYVGLGVNMTNHHAERVAHQSAWDSNSATRILSAMQPIPRKRKPKVITVRHFSFEVAK